MKTRDLIVWGGLALLAWHLFKPKPKKMEGQIGEEYGDDPTEVATAEQKKPALQETVGYVPLPQREEESLDDEAFEAF